MINESIPYSFNEKYTGISLPLTTDGKWVLHLLFEEDRRTYIVGMWLGYDGIYHTRSLPELYKIREGLRMYTRGLITKESPTDFFKLAYRTVNGVKEKAVECTFIKNQRAFVSELDANAMLQYWVDVLKGYSIIKLIRSMSIFSVSTSYYNCKWSSDIERFGRVQEQLENSQDLPDGLKEFMQNNIFSSYYGKEILQKYEELKAEKEK
ncbi:MAG: hypothetical protein PHV10_04290 [Sulfuricurvum sp.]|nr:hypothetical protein [Sulfuricurvum sp.]